MLKMDLKISYLSIKRFRNHELAEFAKRILTIMNNVYDDNSCRYTDKFIQAYREYKNASLNTNNPSALEFYDARNDEVWTGMHYFLKAMVMHSDLHICSAATNIWKEFTKIPNPTRLPFNEEAERLEELLQILEAIPAQTRATARFDEWISMMRATLDNYKLARIQLESQRKDHPIDISQSRDNLLEAYRSMIDTINAMHLLALDGKLNILIPKLNAFIDKIQQQLNKRKQIDEESAPDIDFN